MENTIRRNVHFPSVVPGKCSQREHLLLSEEEFGIFLLVPREMCLDGVMIAIKGVFHDQTVLLGLFRSSKETQTVLLCCFGKPKLSLPFDERVTDIPTNNNLKKNNVIGRGVFSSRPEERKRSPPPLGLAVQQSGKTRSKQHQRYGNDSQQRTFVSLNYT